MIRNCNFMNYGSVIDNKLDTPSIISITYRIRLGQNYYVTIYSSENLDWYVSSIDRQSQLYFHAVTVSFTILGLILKNIENSCYNLLPVGS